jgi:hypothetical protein
MGPTRLAQEAEGVSGRQATSFVLAVFCVALALVLVSEMFPDQWSLIGP